MSDTSRTSKIIKNAAICTNINSSFNKAVDLCKQLGNELIEANERIKRMEEAGNEMCSEFKAFCPLGSKTRDKWRKARRKAKP